MNTPRSSFAPGGASIHLGDVLGIPVRMHWTFLALVGGVWVLSGFDRSVVLLLATVFVCVLFHEFGHGLVAKRLGVPVREIAFWSLGGMTRMEIPEEPRLEGAIAFAGPAVNFALAGLTALGVVGLHLAGALDAPDLGALLQSPLVLFGVVNLMLGVFNLVPAFPMDGGRILRAWFARSTDWLTATERAVRVGRYVALVVLLVALATGTRGGSLCMLPVIALFLYVAGGRELMQVRLRKTGSPFGPGAFGVRFFTSQPFAGARPAEPEAERGDVTLEAPPREAAPDGGFTDESIEALERFRGSLRDRPGDE